MDYKTWEENSEAESTIEVNRDTIRDVYVFPNGTRVYHDTVMPRNIFKPQRQYVVVDKVIPVNKDTKASLKAIGAKITEDWYTEDGFGMPMFCGEDALEKAFTYSMEEQNDRVQAG